MGAYARRRTVRAFGAVAVKASAGSTVALSIFTGQSGRFVSVREDERH